MWKAGTTADGGFTFVELAVVLFIIALFTAAAAPRLAAYLGASRLDREAARLSLLLEQLRDEALFGKREIVLGCIVDEGRFLIRSEAEGALPGVLTRPLQLAETVSITDIVLPGRGKKTDGEAFIAFHPGGGADRAFIHLRGGEGSEVTLELVPFARKVTIHDGYVEKE